MEKGKKLKAEPFDIMQYFYGTVHDPPIHCFLHIPVPIDEAHLIKYTPYFQIAVSIYDDNCTLSCNLYGTPQDKKWIGCFLMEISEELSKAV